MTMTCVLTAGGSFRDGIRSYFSGLKTAARKGLWVRVPRPPLMYEQDNVWAGLLNHPPHLFRESRIARLEFADDALDYMRLLVLA